MQTTSLLAYQELQDGGTLGQKQTMVYNAIKELGQASNLDIAYYLQLPINRITPRTNELVKKDKVEIAKKDLDKHTGKKVIYWKVKN